jgi:hypothetical protein
VNNTTGKLRGEEESLKDEEQEKYEEKLRLI